jgi:hypothetical protein
LHPALDRTLAILLPLSAALLYVVGALLVKRSGDFGVGAWRTAFLSNFTTALLFQLLLPLGGSFHLHLLWQPALAKKRELKDAFSSHHRAGDACPSLWTHFG